MPLTWVAKSASWYMNDPLYKMQNLVYVWVDFSKFGQIWAKIGSNLRKFWKKWVILFKIWPKIGLIGKWMGYFFLKNWYLYGSTFKFSGGTSLPKPNLSTPPGGGYTIWLDFGALNQGLPTQSRGHSSLTWWLVEGMFIRDLVAVGCSVGCLPPLLMW